MNQDWFTTILGLIMPCFGGLLWSNCEVRNCGLFKVLLLDLVITCLIVLVDIYVLIFWQLDDMFGNYP